MKLIITIISVLTSAVAFSQTNFDKDISRILNSNVASESEPGITVGVVQNGELIYHTSKGSMNLEYELSFNDSTVFGLASVTKQFTSACIGILEKQGKLSISDDVRKYIPELANYKEIIQIKHLLNHTSGIRNHNVLLDLQGFDYKHRGYTNKMIQELMFKQKGVNNLPGEKMLYSNTNYVLLALIIERVSGMKIEEFAKQEIFEPLKMHKTFYSKNIEDVIKNRAYPYYQESGKYQQPKSLTHCIGAGGMASTVQDLAKWSNIFLNPNHDFSYLAEFITELDTLNNGQLMKHARGMFVSPYKGFTTYNHSGRDLGMRSQFICVPKKSLAVIIYTNSEDINAVNISYEILNLFMDETSVENQKQNKHEHSITQKKRFEGIYQELNSDLRMEIFVENDTLKAISSFGRNATPLISKSANSLVRLDNPSIVYTFQTKESTDADLLVDFGGAIFYFERIELAPSPNQNLNEIVGNYYSEELNVTYSISIENNNLILSYPNNEGIQIKEGVKDTFGANRRTKYTFNRGNNGKVISFKVASEGTVKDILFEKIN
ncbi:beta-lactamase family protein [Echinicola sp. CAU 1574]|uniref:Beta-lactamase family protein n=1 Tax=Echinicola arenosa TaxID=2774144 RepID=A0ABR9AFR3_9BACT|nr:serine hydrolase domain-containing protein [Echinicola arenosa]MBD8487692.1 beta-lactamase family protein [Echinicola arenosa]